MTAAPWVVVPHWYRFQHYGLDRRPIWIKNYTELLRRDDYLSLSAGARGVLHGIWLAYADRRGQLACGKDLASALRLESRSVAQLTKSLNQAGLIEFVASKPLYLSLEVGTEETTTTRARAKRPPSTSKTALERRRRAAENWIRNGAAAAVPSEHLADWLKDEFKISDSEIVDQLITQAREWQRG